MFDDFPKVLICCLCCCYLCIMYTYMNRASSLSLARYPGIIDIIIFFSCIFVPVHIQVVNICNFMFEVFPKVSICCLCCCYLCIMYTYMNRASSPSLVLSDQILRNGASFIISVCSSLPFLLNIYVLTSFVLV
jgi:hypothetical protein